MTILPLVKNPEKLESRLTEIPAQPGVYLMRDNSDRIIYIGKSRKLRSRVRSYFRDSTNKTERIHKMVRQVTEIEFIVTDTEAEALALEANLIKQHQPYFNVLLKDDKKYPYVCITWSENYPQIFITRKRKLGKLKDNLKDSLKDNLKDKYYGPYTDSSLLREVLHTCKRIFPIRQRQQPLFKDRPCLNYDIGRCPGVCQQLISVQEYHKVVQKIAMVFQGRIEELIETLTAQMVAASEELNFETAAKIRDQIIGLKSLTSHQKVSLPDDTISRDAVALARDDRHTCIQLFQIRAGKLVGRLAFTANADHEPGEILQRVLEEHYQITEAVEIPLEILVQYELPDGDILGNFLTEKKGRKVTIIAPQRQSKAELIEMVEKNAKYELERMQRLSNSNQKSLEDLVDILDLTELPRRIEGYDISHIQGSNAVGSQVVFIDGLPAKQYYRHYKIKNPDVTIGHSDDFASLAEVIHRRFRKYIEDPKLTRIGNNDWPDLVMIDGGKGQLSSVINILSEMGLLADLKVVSLAKKREEIFLPGESQPLETDPEQPGVQLLRRLRDEAHRFAVTFHRQQRSEKFTRSHLDQIPGLGKHRQKLLLGHFRSVDYIREATLTQLMEVSGIGKKLAEEIYDYFHPQ
ncbi:excinuclease ABC subunit UvrC [Anabaena sp. FACHB-1237]|uniref:excinuclease ABC subunit UvrC n=1 Tax=Anabaena sp. FACHB-1237 TaxID=2692769 RepID=UPI0028C40604|nr:excinuclease ABC subunit UvrC [Anabaena sp. FACHB-1237]